MRGCIVKRKDNYAIVLSMGYDAQGKRIQKWVSVKGSKREAQVKLTELLHQYNTGVYSDPKGTLGEFIKRWMGEYVTSNLSPSTRKGYEYIVHAHVNPSLGMIPLRNLKAEHLQTYYADKLAHGLSTTSVRHHHTLLHRALKQAVQWGLMARNPADMVSPPRYRKTEMHTLNESQVSDVLNELEDNSYPAAYRALIFMALHTGLRRSELLGLRWSDVNLEMAELSVVRSVTELGGGVTVFKDTKTSKSRRTVALSPQTCIKMRRYLEEQMEVKAKLELPFKNDDLIFSHLDGTPLKGNTVWKAWHTLVNRMGYQGVRFHDIRHTMATAMLQAGIHPKIVQERLGHSSITTTLDTYSHVAPGLQQAAAAKLDGIFTNLVSNRLANTTNIDKIEAIR